MGRDKKSRREIFFKGDVGRRSTKLGWKEGQGKFWDNKKKGCIYRDVSRGDRGDRDDRSGLTLGVTQGNRGRTRSKEVQTQFPCSDEEEEHQTQIKFLASCV